MFEKVLALSPHTGDAELGAGGTLARFLEEGKQVYYVAFSDCSKSIPDGLPAMTLREECFRAVRNIGIPQERVKIMSYEVRTFPEHRQEILEDLIALKKSIAPDLVLAPSSRDVHQDHKTIYAEALRAFKWTASIWGYEHPWNNLTFSTDVFVRLDSNHLEKKVRALSEYRSQQFRSYMKERNIISLLYTRGSQLNVEYAEVFELIRMIY